MPRPASPSTGSSTPSWVRSRSWSSTGRAYAVHGEFARGQQATSKLLPGFAVDVTAALAAKR